MENLTLAAQLQEEGKARVEYYQPGKSETQAAIDSAKGSCMDFLDSISKTLPLQPKVMRKKFGWKRSILETTSIVKMYMQRRCKTKALNHLEMSSLV